MTAAEGPPRAPRERASMTDLLAADRAEHNVPVLTVSEVSRSLKDVVESAFPWVRVRGEISGFKRAQSGHLYFTLKDADAVLDAVCWRGTGGRLTIAPEDGMEVVATGRLTTYAGRSKYQIVVEALELAGEGALLKLLEERKRALERDGLFDPERKRPLPFLPDVIGVVTSPTGAVIRDILHRVGERFPCRVLVWPVRVQGDGAAAEIAAAIEGFNRLGPDTPAPRPDVLIVARGGGSIEDLWAFNEEVVVRAAAASGIPLIAAVGHETDVTLIDFAADVRAPTPTAAAEMAVPVRIDLHTQVTDAGRRLLAASRRILEERRVRPAGARPRPSQPPPHDRGRGAAPRRLVGAARGGAPRRARAAPGADRRARPRPGAAEAPHRARREPNRCRIAGARAGGADARGRPPPAAAGGGSAARKRLLPAGA